MTGHRSQTADYLLVIAGLVVAFALVEAGLRIYNPFGFRMRGNRIVLPANKTYRIEDSRLDKVEKLDKVITHTKNSLGFRGPEPPPDFSRRLTIIAIGGSTTECFFLSDDRTWPARLEAKLKPVFPSVWVNNAGLDGHSTFGHLALMSNYISKLRPKFALLLAGANDIFTDAPKQFDKTPMSRLVGSLADHSEVVALAVNLVRHARTRRFEALGAMPRPLALRFQQARMVSLEQERALVEGEGERLRGYQERLERLAELARSSGIELVLLTQPALVGDAVDDATGADLAAVGLEMYQPMNGHVAWRLLELYNDVTRSVGRRRGLTVVDLAREMPKSSRYYYDFFHFTNEGAEKVGDIIFASLCPVLGDKQPALAAAPCPR